MECRNHPGVAAADRCSACMEPFCSNCLVTIKGRKFCGSCKVTALGGVMPVVEGATEPCPEANEALKYALIGIICFGIILEPIAISKALAAKKMIAANPNLTGSGKATAALIIAPIVLILWVLSIIARVKGM
jgi:hypothetical protein